MRVGLFFMGETEERERRRSRRLRKERALFFDDDRRPINVLFENSAAAGRAVQETPFFATPSFCMLRSIKHQDLSTRKLQQCSWKRRRKVRRVDPEAPRKREFQGEHAFFQPLRSFLPSLHRRAPLHRTAEARAWDRVQRIVLKLIDRDDGKDMN